ncbi:MAG: hypothetical protein OXG15_03000 [Gammaproteobacteria bacterium]|nr:hypothetical protein [Gammaproteobacteria bacterium]
MDKAALPMKSFAKPRNAVVRFAQLALLMPIVFLCSFINAQTAFSSTNVTLAWSEDPALQSSQLSTLNTRIQGALNASADDFCFAIETTPTDLLEFPALNCTIGSAASPNGYTSANASFALALGDMPFDYDSRVAHTLTLTANETSTTPQARTANNLHVTFTLSNIDEPPVLTDGAFRYVAPPAHSEEARYLEVGDTFQYNIGLLFRDPEGAPVSLPHSTIEVCDTGVAGNFVENPARCYSYSNLPASPDVLSVEARGTLLVATANGVGMSNAGVYWAKLYFGASDQTSNITTKQQGANVTVFVKQGVNNPPQFAGGASGFSISIDEVATGNSSVSTINPMPLGAWNAQDLDGDAVEYSLVGAQANCRDTGMNAVQIGEMCIAVVQPASGVALRGYYLDYESPFLSPTKSLSVTLRASDGWNHADIAIEITLINVNELYAHTDPTTQSVLPTTVRLLQGSRRSFNLDSYFTDPEMDAITYTVFPNALTDLVEHSGSSLTLVGVGTSAANPTISDIVTVRATDGTLTVERTIQVEVRNTNTPPRFEPAGVIGVAGDINENVPLGTAVSRLVQYADDDSNADEIIVTLSSSDFSAIVNPIWDGSNVCQSESATCLRQPNRIAIVSAAAINFEQTSTYTIRLGLNDGYASSDPNRNFTITVTVHDVNDAPMASGNIANRSLSVQGTSTFSAGEYFSDEDAGDRLIVHASSSNPSAVTVSVQGVNQVTITGAAIGTSTITLTATDNAGLTATQTFQVTVQTNQSPVANAEAFTSALPANLEMLVGEIHDVPLSGLFTDPEGDTITVTVASSAQGVLLATVTGSGENAEAVLTARALGSSDLTFTATDTAGNETTETRTIEVVSERSVENRAPEVNQTALDAALPSNNEIVVNRSIELTLTDFFSDPDGDELTFEVESSARDIVLPSLATDNVALFLFGDAVGTATITITATDTEGNTASVEIEFTVVEEAATENRPPVLNQTAFEAALPTDNTIQQRNYHEFNSAGLFTDPDGDDMTIQVVSSNTSVLRVSGSAGSSTTFLIARSIGSADLSVTATDTEGNATMGMATISVVANESDGENQPPVLDRDAFNAALPANNRIPVPEFFELELDTMFTDPNPNDSVAGYDVSSSDDSVLLVVLDPGNILTAFARTAGSAMMTIVARDTEGAETTVTETITVTAAAANALVLGPQTLDRSAPLTVDIRDLLPDTDLRNATFNLQPVVRDASLLNTQVDGSRLTLTALNQGETFVKLTVTNESGYSARTMFFVNVVNAAPTLVTPLDDLRTTRVSDLALDLRDAFQDADGEPVVVTARTLDDSIIDSTFDDGVLTISGLQVGETTVTLIAVDTNGATTEASFKVSVDNIGPSVNEAAGPIQLQVGGEPYHLVFGDWFTDEDDALTYTSTLDAANVVQASVTEIGATYTPLTQGNVGLTVTASDPHGGTVSVTTEIVVGDERLKEVAAKSLAGFGRAMVSSVAAAIEKRTSIPRGNSDLSNDAWLEDEFDEWVALSTSHQALPNPASAASTGGGMPLNSLIDGVGGRNLTPIASDPVSPLSTGFSFEFSSDEKSTPWSVWSNVNRQSYNGESYDGTLTNTYLGIDKEVSDAWVLGLTITRHEGESNYTYGTATQHMGIELNQLMPYFRYGRTDHSSIWGTIGVGRGDLGTSVVGAADASSVLKSELAVLGGRQRVANSSRFELALRGDLAVSRLATTEGEAANAGLNANVHRVRTGIETSYALEWIGGSTLTPFGQLNLRSDRGDGDTGSGFEFTGGLRLSQSVYSVELMGRTFETRGQQSYTERGFTMTATVNPSHDGTGFSATVSPQWGANVPSSDAIWNDLTPVHGIHPLRNPGQAATSGGMKLDSQVGYGVLIADERFLLTPFIQHVQYSTEQRQSQIGAQLRQFVISKASISSRFTFGRMNTLGNQDEIMYRLSVQMSF